MIKVFTICFTLIGIMFLLTAILIKQSAGNLFGISFPRNYIAHIGFIIVGVLYIIISFGLYLCLKDKKTIIEENDERNQKIQAFAGLYAFLIQSLLLFTGLFLMIFMGYMNVISAFYLCFVIVISTVIFAIIQLYYRQKM